MAKDGASVGGKCIELHHPSRTLKIEPEGDFWKGIKPKIRIMGYWLARAGFKPGDRVQVTCVSPGVIELRSPDALLVDGPEHPNCPF